MSYQLYAPTAIAAAQAYGIDPSIFIAQISQESGWNPSAVSPAGAQGIAQFMPQTAAGMGITNPFDPEEALYGAAALMAQNLQMFGGDYSLALAAYNAGPGAVQQYGGVPPYEETQRYVTTILGGSQGGDDMSFPDLWPFNNDDEEGGDERDPLNEYSWTPEERVKFLGEAGLTWVSGNGPDSIWQLPDGDRISEQNAFEKLLGGSGAINFPAGSTGSTTAPPRVTSNGVTYERQPDGSWAPAQGIPPSMGSTAAPSGFTLSGGQTRYGPDGRIIAQAPTDSDPYAGVKLQQANMDLLLKQQNLKFLQDKHAFEMQMGKQDLALRTEQQIHSQRMDIASLQNNIAQFNARMQFDTQQANIHNERLRQQQLQGLATDIGTLAQDPGDRAKYASTVLANSAAGFGGFGQDKAQSGLITNDSLMPLESLLRQRQDLMGGTPQITTPATPGINLGALGQQPTAQGGILRNDNPQYGPEFFNPPTAQGFGGQTPGYDPTVTGGISLDADAINEGAQYSPTPDPLSDMLRMMASGGQSLPQKAQGGMEDEAFIAGEKGPEIVIPHGDKAIILNAEQAKTAGIDLSKLVKFADGGLFDGLIKDDDRGLATDFLAEATTRAKSGTPWEGRGIPGPTFASSPGFDPLVAQLMASINGMETGLPAASYLRSAQMRRPVAMQEGAIRRTA